MDSAASGTMPPASFAARTFGARRMPPPLETRQPALTLNWHFVLPLRNWLAALVGSLKSRAVQPREAAVQALLRSDFSATFVRILAYLGALAILALVSAEIFRSSPVGAAIEPPAPPEWITVAKPFPAFALNMPELADGAHGYGMRRHAIGGGRKDIMTWGDLNGTAPHLTVEIYRPGSEFTRFSSAAREIAASTEGLVTAQAVKPVEAIDSKFGSVSLVEFSPGKDGTRRQCLGFARSFDRPQLQMLGWYCISGPEVIERSQVACALDRLTLLSAGSDGRIGELFAHAELKRNFCGQRSPLLAATPKLGSGPTLGPEAKLRGTLSAR